VRLFVALYPPPAVLDHLAAAVAGLRLGRAAAAGTNVRLVARPLWHVTVAFLGEVDERRAGPAAAALQAAAAQWRAAVPGPMRLRLAGVGRFGRGRFTVLWVGVAGDLDRLRSLNEGLRRQLRRARVPYDRKPLRPHVTFARPGDRIPAEDLRADLTELGGYAGPEWEADSLHLVRSHPGPKPVYEPVASAPLSC
jgi:2'-5' RNA ligase